MKAPTSVFQVGRMRWLDMLTLYHLLHPDSHEKTIQLLAGTPPDALAALLLDGRTPRR